MKTSILKLALFSLLLPVLMFCQEKDGLIDEPNNFDDLTPRVGDYYVSVDGKDSNPGTDSLPWRTIKKAVSVLEPGEVLIVKKGNYNELVKVKHGGFSNKARIYIVSEVIGAAKCIGFRIDANYVTVDGFDVEANTKSWAGIIVKNASYVNIKNCYVHECPSGGIIVKGNTKKVNVINNKLVHNGIVGISLIGQESIILNNEVSSCVQFHPKGKEPNFTGHDADGIKVYGSGHLIKGNKIVNIGDPSDGGNINPHADGLQSWNGKDRKILSNSVIEGNYISVPHKSGKGILLETNGPVCRNIVIRNNIIEFCDIGVAAFSGKFENIKIHNNIFRSKLNHKSWGTSAFLKNVKNYEFINNITVDCHPEHRKIIGTSGKVDYNILWNSNGETLKSMTPGKQKNEIVGQDPKFIDFKESFGKSDYHLKPESPVIDKGISLPNVLFDFDSIPRPQGKAFDLGAYEYKSE